MAQQTFPRDRFDGIPDGGDRIGAHRAENPRMRGGLVLLWAVLATIVLVAAGIFGTMVLGGKITLFPAATETPVATPTPEVRIDTSTTVLVLNATTETGLATATKDTIVAAGWDPAAVYATDAAADDFATTTVYYATADDAAAARGLAEVIGGADVIESAQYQPEPTGGAEVRQLTVVLGLDRVAATGAPAS